MQKLIIIIGCALAAQLQADDDITVNVVIVNEQPRHYAASISPAQITQEYEKLYPELKPNPKPLPPLVLPSNGLDDYEVLEKLPADAVIQK